MITPTEIKGLCDKYGLRPSKRYGQNYLINPGIIKKIVETADIGSSDTIIEIGPGFGVRTFALADKAKRVVSIEIEKKLDEYWSDKTKEYKNIDIHWGNVLHMFPKLERDISSKYKLVANLPYQITSHALRLFLDSDKKPEKIVVMVQKEVAERIVAKPGNMSTLSVAVQYYGTPKIISKVSKGSFWPSPKVDSAILSITNIQNKKNSKHFFDVVRAGFSNKRKQLWRNLHEGLKAEKEEIKNMLKSIKDSEKVRAQELSVEEWIKLSDML